MANPRHAALVIIAAFQLSTFMIGISETVAAPEALFVFGDSYADTGNHRNGSSTTVRENKSCRTPYGSTWPGSPTCRYSNGRVFTDFYSVYLGVDQPTPYARANSSNSSIGINFAFGGSGVFPTASFCPNVSAQIAQFRGTLDDGLVSQDLVSASLALVTVNGNDYTQFISDGGSISGIAAVIAEVTQQLTADIEALYGLGFRTLAVSNLAPVGCLPTIAKSSNYTSCVAAYNTLATYHNALLASAMARLRTNFSDAEFILLDFNQAFDDALQGFSNQTSSELRSCCEGTSDGVTCGELDDDGIALYTVCSSPSEYFFWDEFHPSDIAWEAISNALLSSSVKDH